MCSIIHFPEAKSWSKQAFFLDYFKHSSIYCVFYMAANNLDALERLFMVILQLRTHDASAALCAALHRFTGEEVKEKKPKDSFVKQYRSFITNESL